MRERDDITVLQPSPHSLTLPLIRCVSSSAIPAEAERGKEYIHLYIRMRDDDKTFFFMLTVRSDPYLTLHHLQPA